MLSSPLPAIANRLDWPVPPRLLTPGSAPKKRKKGQEKILASSFLVGDDEKIRRDNHLIY